MRIEYRGMSEDRDEREAYITYEPKEQEKADKVFKHLEGIGYKVEHEEECACIFVYDKEEYNEVVECYKEAKKIARAR